MSTTTSSDRTDRGARRTRTAASGPATRQADVEITDGRVRRTAVTRRKILEATRKLLLAGVVEPTAREIAAQAGITPRTLFRHFTDVESLYREFVGEAEHAAVAVMNEAFEADGVPWQVALDRVIERRMRVFESLLPLYVSGMWNRHRGGLSAVERRAAASRRRQRLVQVLPAELAGDSALFEALDATLGIGFWASLRRVQMLDVAAAGAALRRAVECLTRK